MARISLGLCLMLAVASSVVYETQGHFLLKNYLTTQFPSKGSEFTPYVNKGLTELATDLERGCPPTPEFKSFFTEFKSYMSSIETSSSTSTNIETEMAKKGDGLFKACSAITGGAGEKSAEAGSFKSTMMSMAKTLVEQKKSTSTITSTEKKTLVTSMVKWTKTIATTVKTASEKKGKKIDINTFGLDVDINDKSIMTVSGSSQSSSSHHKTSSESSTQSQSSNFNARAENESSAKAKLSGGSVSATEEGGEKDEKKEKPEKDDKKEKAAEKKEPAEKKEKPEKKEKDEKPAEKKKEKKEKDSAGASTTFSDTTGAPVGSPKGSPSSGKSKASGSPKASPSSSKDKTSEKGSEKASSKKQEANAASASSMNQEQSKTASSSSKSTTTVTEIEKETSQETMSFISGLEKKYSQKAELKPFFEKLKASMTASAKVASTKSAQDYSSTAKSTTGKLIDAMTFVGSRFSKSAEMKSSIKTTQEKLMTSLKQFQDLNSKIVGEKKVSTTQETEIKQKISKIEQVTTQFLETAASSSSTQASSTSKESQKSQKQSMASSEKQTAATSQQENVDSSQQQNSMGKLKNN
ncbi:unnamed protein product [Eruca vesicaria subsp. sativa]|uniref:DUF1216 domain-containing protein n=1 Tax=Eruca vesicaria subsp. sativa TaxID=29727 RepID=A0ABC8LZ20_ERUVS|nr:unnamed protein product [Eruca vesicaria subsp. sativa]